MYDLLSGELSEEIELEEAGAVEVVFDPSTGDATHRRYWEDIMNSGETVDLENPNIRTALSTIFAGQTSTLNAIAALQTKSITRAEELALGPVHAGDVAGARAL